MTEQLKRYTADENYSELIEDGAWWVRYSDHAAAVAALEKRVARLLDEQSQYEGLLDDLTAESDSLRAKVGELERLRADTREEAMQDCWNAVDDLMNRGHLPTAWQNEQRNGLVHATNAITALIDSERAALSQEKRGE